MIFIDLMIYGLFLFLLLWKGKAGKYIDGKEQVLDNLNLLRGIFALEIIVGHVIRFDKCFLYPLGKFMICGVAFFFFVSAMGLSISFQKRKEKYLTYKFLLTKPGYLFLLAIIIYIINFLIDLFTGRGVGYYSYPVFSNFFEVTNWYIWKQAAFYIVFFLVYKYIKKYRLTVMFSYTVLACVLLYYLGFVEGWWASGLAFPMGLLFGEYYEQMKKLLYSLKGLIIIGACILFGSLCLIIPAENVITMVFMRNIMCVAAIAVFWFLCSHFRFGNNRISKILCAISTELYISQFIWLRLSETYHGEYYYRLLFVGIGTFVTAVCLHPIVNLLKRMRLRVNDI